MRCRGSVNVVRRQRPLGKSTATAPPLTAPLTRCAQFCRAPGSSTHRRRHRSVHRKMLSDSMHSESVDVWCSPSSSDYLCVCSRRDPPAPICSSRLYVGGISWNIDDQGLRDVFSQFGQCEATIMKYKNNRSRGFGFVTYQSAEGCTRAIEEMNGKCCMFCPAHARVGNSETLCSGPAHDHGISRMCSAPSSIHAYTRVCMRSNAIQGRSWMVRPLHASTLGSRRTTKLQRREQGASPGRYGRRTG